MRRSTVPEPARRGHAGPTEASKALRLGSVPGPEARGASSFHPGSEPGLLEPRSTTRTGASGLWLWNQDRDQDQDQDWDQQLRSSARLPLPVGVEPLLKVGARGRRASCSLAVRELWVFEPNWIKLNWTEQVEPMRLNRAAISRTEQQRLSLLTAAG